MADPNRYSGRYAPASGRRSPVYHPARSSMPVGVNYAPYADPYAADPYGGDIHVMPISHHDGIIPVRAPGDYRTNSIPITTTTYAVKKEREPAAGISRSTSVREGATHSRPHRSHTLDSSKRPPIIVTTKHAPQSSSSQAPSHSRSDSPTRDPYRTSEEGQYYTQPGTSIHRARSTNHAPPHSAALDNDEYARLKDRTGEDRLRAGGYRPPRDPPLYAYDPRPPAAVDIGNEGYEYTKPSDLARYDLDTNRPHRHSRRDSFDQGYYRPSVSVSTDIGRPYEQNERRSRGPPPTSRGLDKVNRAAEAGMYDAPQIRMPVPPAAPLAPNPRSGHLAPESPPIEHRRGTSRTRPVSLSQDAGYPRDPYYQRDARDRDYFHDDVTTRGFGIRTDAKDLENVRREPVEPESRWRDERKDKRDSRLDDRDTRRRSDEDLDPVRRRDDRRDYVDVDPSAKRDIRKGYEEISPRRRSDDEWEFVPRKDDRKEGRDARSPPTVKVHDEDGDRKSRHDDVPVRDRKEGRDRDPVDYVDDERDTKKEKIKERVTAGLGIAAAAIGLGTALKEKDGKDAKDVKDVKDDRRDDRKDDRRDDRRDDRKEERSSHRRSRDSDDLRSWESGGEDLGPSDRHRPSRRDGDDKRMPARDDIEIIEPPRGRDDDRPRKERPAEASDDTRRRNRRAAEAALTGETLEPPSRDASSSSADATSSRSRRKHVRASGFDPNDTSDLVALKAQLAAQEGSDRRDRSPPTARERSSEKRSSLTTDDMALVPAPKDDDDGRGRELVVSGQEEKQVRVVSPPRDKDDKKPIKGILKQPKPQFPEEPNPIREGVAPHKSDKTKADVPSGARWTKINRSLVNPDALTIGKERFEVRDDFVIVLRVLSKEEIQAYATATAQLREMKRQEFEKEKAHRGDDDEKDDDERRRRHRHHRRERDDDYDDDRRERDRERDRDGDRDRDGHRRRRHRQHEIEGDGYDDDVEDRPKAIEYHGHGHHRSHRVGE